MFITAVCVLFLIKLRWPKTKSLYDTVHESPFEDYVRLSCALLQQRNISKNQRKKF